MPSHDQHDRLLVGQLVAGDPLDPTRAAEARALLMRCPECAALAADLRLLPAMVAHEPVPPRRRDFRLSPQQAEQLSGNAVTRFLRRLSLPQAHAFAPAAGAVMSIGLVFVVAGYAWPDGSTLSVPSGAVEEPAPSAIVTPAADGFESLSQEAASPVADAVDGADAPGPAEDEDTSNRARSLAAPDGATPDPEFFESLPESQAGTSEALMQQELAVEASPVQDAVAEMAAAAEAMDAGATDADATALLDDMATMFAEATGAPAAKAADDAALAGGADATLDGATGPDTSEGLERLLIVVGAALAVAGGALLLLSWLVRRTSDPLLR
jgi:hypothetical protein